MLNSPKYYQGIQEFASTVISNLYAVYSNSLPFPQNVNKYKKDLSEVIRMDVFDTMCVIGIAITLIFGRFIHRRFVSNPAAIYFKIEKAKNKNFLESTYKLFVTLISFTLVNYVFFTSSQVRTYEDCFQNPKLIKIPFIVRSTYIYQIAAYVDGLFAIIFVDCGRKDHFVMLIHHFAAISLLMFSLSSKYVYPGITMLFIHSFGDIFLEFCKICLYIRASNKSIAFNIFLHILYIILISSWFLLRFVFFFDRIIFPWGYYLPKIFKIEDMPFYATYLVLVLTLYFQNIYWLFLIIKSLVYRIYSGGFVDIREVKSQKTKDDKVKTT